MIQAHIFYSGIVQGVGFRYTVQNLARDLNLAGWVRNLRDGRVEVLVEGSQEVVEQLLKEIEGHFEGCIRNKEIEFQAGKSQFKDFQITY